MIHREARSRGYTLIELILVIGLLGIVLTTIGLMVRQGYQLHYVQLDRLEAHQNGRTALEFIKSSLREAAWGGSNGLNHRGTIVVGGCFDDALADSKVCNNVDDGSDRIRIYRGLAEPHVFRQAHNSKAGGLGIAVGPIKFRSHGNCIVERPAWSDLGQVLGNGGHLWNKCCCHHGRQRRGRLSSSIFSKSIWRRERPACLPSRIYRVSFWKRSGDRLFH